VNGMGATVTKTPLDHFDYEIIANSLTTIAREMAVVLARSSYSSILNEGLDFSCAIFTSDGDLATQNEGCMVHLGAMHESVKSCMRTLNVERFRAGDVYLVNDPYQGGSHLPDITMFSPVFVDDELVCFAGTRAHHPDVGGMCPGSFCGDATELIQEGVVIPPVRLFTAGEPDEQIFSLLLANMRAPHIFRGDCLAQVAALRLCEERVRELAGRHGAAGVRDGMQRVIAYSERMMRAAIADLPDGRHEYFDFMEGVKVGDPALRVHVALEVHGDELTFDYSRSSDQVPHPINCPYAVTASVTYGVVRCVLGPEIPPNVGSFRPVRIRTRTGSLCEAEWPAPVAGGQTNCSQRIFGVALGALARIVPDRVTGVEHGANSDIGFGGVDPRTGDPYVMYLMPVGGTGGRKGIDGMSGTIAITGNCASQPVEVLENVTPFFVREYQYRPDSGGAGEWRGGCGERIRYGPVGHETRGSIFIERTRVPPWGTLLGRSALVGHYGLTTSDGTYPVKRKTNLVAMKEGDEFVAFTAGGGGYGDPLRRDPERVADDVRDEIVSLRSALDDYGVVLGEGGCPDLARTSALRDELAGRRARLRVRRVLESDRHAIALAPGSSDETGEEIGEGDLLELSDGQISLRGWARIDPSLNAGQVDLEPLYLEALDASVGSVVDVRNLAEEMRRRVEREGRSLVPDPSLAPAQTQVDPADSHQPASTTTSA
jgi:N-methylhydantoinase B